MKSYSMLIALSVLGGCSLSPAPVERQSSIGRDSSCEVGYPQLPRCECGCAGDICTTGSMGVVVCGSDRASGLAIIPARNTTASAD